MLQELSEDIKNAKGDLKKDADSDIDSGSMTSQIRQLQADRYSSDTRDRKWLAQWATCVVSLWLFFVLLIVCLSKHLSDAVLITLLGTTTLNVLGLSFIVLRGHFNGDQTAFKE